MHAKSLLSCLILCTPWTVARQAPLSMGLSRQEYWSGLPCPPPGDLPNPGIEPISLVFPDAASGFFTTNATQGDPSAFLNSEEFLLLKRTVMLIFLPNYLEMSLSALHCFEIRYSTGEDECSFKLKWKAAVFLVHSFVSTP